MTERPLEERLTKIVRETEWFMGALRTVAPLMRDPWCIAAGAVMGLVWNHGTARSPWHGAEDLDVVYFDAIDMSEESEAALEQAIRGVLPSGIPPPDVKNQARVHQWYEGVFGHAITPHDSIGGAMTTWPATAGAVGISLRDGVPQITAPFGLEDLFARRVRPNKRLVTKAIFDEKVRKWRRRWPEIDVVEWDEKDLEI